MGKLIGGLGLCLVLGALNPAFSQDPFDPSNFDAPALILPAQSEPIIQNMPTERGSGVTNRPYTRSSRQKNTHVRATRTPAQEAIYQRALYRAAQRTKRMEERKLRNISLLRPDNHTEHFSGYVHTLPVWEYHYAR